MRGNAVEWVRASELYGESAFGVVKDGFAPDDVAQVRACLCVSVRRVCACILCRFHYPILMTVA